MNKNFRTIRSACSRFPSRNKSGQALVEFSLVLLTLVLLAYCLVDFCVAIYEKQLLTNISREAANLAARGGGPNQPQILPNALAAIEMESTPLNLSNSTSGKIILTVVTNGNGNMFISQQVSAGHLSVSSKIGTGVGSISKTKLPNTNLVQVGGSCYIAEVFYVYKPPAPLRIVGLSNVFYDVAYFQ
ncbi:MAG TPA: TadE/TadG family type IV pilus assembly protein [Verrucomicrobiae bacterium]|nr:TadE/TadG family type IV pilus assembly protein [Verrucomicrobiae bacterium]